MTRSGLFVALAIAVLVGVIFGLYPELDLKISALFVHAGRQDFTFGLRFDPTLLRLRQAGLWLVFAIAAPAAIALIGKALFPRRHVLMTARAAIFLLASLALGPGLLTNVLLKDHWGRSRPVDVRNFDGAEHFVPWWDPRGDCPNNCSFVSGDVSGAFWTLAPAALAPPPWRALAYAAALAFGAGMALLRIAAGAHFFSDTAFAGTFTYLVIWLCHALIYRRPTVRAREDPIMHRGSVKKPTNQNI